MKISLEVDCTPDEARAFLGLPDIKPLQTKVLARVEEQLLAATSAFSADNVLKMWFNAMPLAAEQYLSATSKLLERASTGR